MSYRDSKRADLLDLLWWLRSNAQCV